MPPAQDRCSRQALPARRRRMSNPTLSPAPITESAPTHCRVGVVGLGYAGLPQAVAFAAAGHPVVGLDIDSQTVAALKARRSPVDTVADRELASVSGRFSATGDPGDLSRCSAVLICVPTPLDTGGRPDLSALRSATTTVAANLSAGQLVVVMSTVYPGATEDIVQPILESSGLRAGADFNLAFAPERVDPGNPLYTASNTAKVVGGLTPVCAHRSAELFGRVVSEVHLTKGLREAEASKILENTYRQVNLALAHEFASYCAVQGIDVTSVIDAAATKPFGFQPFYPGVGVGGHCIPVDPAYLSASARSLGVPMHLVETAQRINDERPLRVAERCQRALAAEGTPIEGARVVVLGVTYKPNVRDVRNTPVESLVRRLSEMGLVVSVHDPLVDGLMVDGTWYRSVADPLDAVLVADLVILAQRHRDYGPDLLRNAERLCVAGS